MQAKNRLKLSFSLMFFLISFYIVAVQTEKFHSSSMIMIKDLSTKQSPSILGAVLLGQSSSAMQDSKLLELYIRSSQMFTALDKENNLTAYYTSKKIDFIQRLSTGSLFSFREASPENIMERYNKDISIFYDDVSSTLEIGFLHADADLARQVVQNIIDYSTKALNRFEKENARVALSALMTQEQENKMRFTESIKKLIIYQNQHNTIDPSVDVQSKSAILAGLEGELVQKEVEYKSKLSYLNKNAAEMKLIQENIHHIVKGITKLKSQMVGDSVGNELNKNVSNYELLKSEVEFNKELYKQTLIKLEEIKVSVKQNAKNLIVITKPLLPTTYSEPQKFKDMLTWLIILSFLYGILSLILSILKDHKD